MDNYKYNPIKEDTNEGKIDIINLLPKIHRESYKKEEICSQTDKNNFSVQLSVKFIYPRKS